MNKLVNLWASNVPENYYNFQKIFHDDQISNFLPSIGIWMRIQWIDSIFQNCI